MQSLPLMYFPTSIVWVDDDPLLLEAMQLEYSQKLIKPFGSAAEVLDFFQSYKAPSENYSLLRSNTEDDYYSDAKHTPVDLDITELLKVANDPDRHQEVSIIVADYSMPNMNGLELLSQLKNQNSRKILLTGFADYDQAIEGFNNKLIQRFVQKGKPDMVDTLSNYFIELSVEFFKNTTAHLLAHLEAEQKLPISDPVFVEFFLDYAKQNNIYEYYVADKQGSLLCVNDQGERSILAVHSDSSLDTWISIYGEDSSTNLNSISTRTHIPYFPLGQEAADIDEQEWQQHFHACKQLSGRNNYYYATVNLPCIVDNAITQ